MRSLARLDATFLVCAFSVFGRPLGGGQEIKDLNGDSPFLSADWRSTALSFLPTLSDLSSQVNPAPFFGSFAPDALSEVKQDVSANQFGSGDTQNRFDSATP